MPRLILNPGTEGTQVYDLQPGTYEIGRHPDASICIADNSVSGLHCKITIDGNLARLTDLGSTNGTFVDSQPVTTAELRNAQSLRLGSVSLLFEADGTASPSPVPLTDSPHPARGRLRVEMTAPAAVTDQPEIIEPQPEPRARAAHIGAASCKYHPRSAARWHCPKCGRSFCEMCVSTRATPHGTSHLCRTCAVTLAPLQVQVQRQTTPAFSTVIWSAFAYPFGKDGVLALIAGCLLFAVMSVAANFFWWATILFYGYFFSYLQNVIQATAMGESQVDWPTPTDVLSEIILPAFQVFVCGLVSFGPAIGLFVWGAAEQNPAVLAGGIIAVVYGCFYFPMAFLAVAMFDSVAGVNPLLVIPSIGRVFGKYLIACLVLGVVFAISEGLAIGLALLIPIPFVPDAIASMFSLYFLLVECRILGLLYWTNSRRLGWFNTRI